MTTGLPLAGKVALVTGGAGGIGSACARALAQDGAAVTLMGRTPATLEATVADLRSTLGGGAELSWFAGDAMVAEDVQGAVRQASAALGELHICVATVGGGTIAPFLVLDEHVLLEELRRNIVGAFLAIKHVVPVMVTSGGGTIVCISSDAGHHVLAVHGRLLRGKGRPRRDWCGVAADEFGHHAIRVNAVRPG